MAQSLTKTTADTMDKDQTVCPVCFEQLKSPKFLSCLHTFCTECIKQLEENKEIICPLCRVKTSLGSGSVNNLRHNYFIESLIHISNAETPICETCNKRAQSEHYCYDCEQYLCLSCFGTHQALRMSRTHRSTAVGSIKRDRMTRKSFCAQHRDEELRFVCKRCNKSICRDCKVTSHEGHTTVDLEKHRKESADSMVNVLDEIDEMIEKLTNTNNAIDYLNKMCLKSFCDAYRSSESLRKRIHEKIDKEFDSINASLEETEKKQLDNMKREKQSFSAIIHALSWRRNHIKLVLQFGTTADVVETNRMIKDLSPEYKKDSNPELNLRLVYPSISTNAEHFSVPRLLDFKVKFPFKFEKVSTIVLKDIYPLWISKIQVTDANECYISLQHQHKSVVNMPFTLMRYKENGQLMDYRKCQPIKDIVWSNEELLMLYENYFDTIPPQVKEKEEKEEGDSDNTCTSQINPDELFQWKYVCAFEHLTLGILILNIHGILKQTNDTIVCNLTDFSSVPTSAACSKGGDILVCFPDHRCITMYDIHGKVKKRFDNSVYLVLSKTFQPRDIAIDSLSNAYVVDYENDSVFRIDIENGIVLPLILKCREIARPLTLAIDMKGRLWIGHSKDKITIYSIL